MKTLKKIEFNRPTKYQFVATLGKGACGETIHIRDEGMNADLVAKKYMPIVSEQDNSTFFQELLKRFRDEARILFRLNHPNIVRVFNYFDYSEHKTAYIIMEHVSGEEILEYLRVRPASADRVFEGVVEGFTHLQMRDVLHRDIRPANILVDSNGVPKIIDFGFGKQIEAEQTNVDKKSISLNWWCDTPPEFADGVYDFQTEVYFVGKLFQLAIEEYGLSDFKYKLLLGKMCEPDRSQRLISFSEIKRSISQGKFSELAFSKSEIEAYRDFAGSLSEVVSSIQSDAKFERDTSKILGRLEELHRKTMLEEVFPSPNRLVQVFVVGSFRYWSNSEMYVVALQKFVELFKGLSEEKRSIVVENLVMRLEACERTEPRTLDDEIPF